MTGKDTVPTRDDRRSPFVLVGIALVVLVGALAGWLLVGATRQAVSIHTAVPSSAEGAISIEADGWTYGVPLDGVRWIDANNTWHEDGRPDCLPAMGTTHPVTFAAVEVTVGGATWRPVVWVDCR
jgi:hypothetical protein